MHTVVCFLLGNSPASEFYMPTFRNTLFHLHRRIGMKMEQAVCSETSAYKIQTPGNYPEKKHTTFRTRRKFEIKKMHTDFWRGNTKERDKRGN